MNVFDELNKQFHRVTDERDKLFEENRALKESRNELLFLAKMLNDICVVQDPRNTKIIFKAEVLKKKIK